MEVAEALGFSREDMEKERQNMIVVSLRMGQDDERFFERSSVRVWLGKI